MASQTARLCVFDLDGTLVESAPDLVAALNQVLVAEGLPEVDFSIARAYVGHGARVLIERAYAANDVELSDEQASELTERFVGHYAQNIADGTMLYPFALEAMDEMADAGWMFAVCTNKREALARQLLEALDIADRFEAICGGDTFPERKPNGQHVLKTIAAADGDPKRSIMVGDSQPDILAAKDAGIPVIGVPFGYSLEPIGTYSPDEIVESFADLAENAEKLMPA